MGTRPLDRVRDMGRLVLLEYGWMIKIDMFLCIKGLFLEITLSGQAPCIVPDPL